MRIAIGQVMQESNTFNPLPTTRADFEAMGIFRGNEIIEKLSQTNEIGGMIQTLRGWPEAPEIVGLIRFLAWPAGAATAGTYDWLRDEMVQSLRSAGPIDAVLMVLHGAMVSQGPSDVEGGILEATREVIGPKTPLVATLDLHADVTERMVRAADALVLYHTAPHVDVYETGERSATVLRRILDGARPVKAFQKLPFVVPAERANTQDPQSVSFKIRELLQEWERDPRILTAGLATVQPWLDIPGLGTSVVVVTDDNEELARSKCSELSRFMWDHRRDYLPTLVSVAEGVQAAFAQKEGLVVLSDSADATTSGSTGDSNHVLREMLKYDWSRPALVTLVDPGLVAEAEERGVGAELKTLLGGKRDPAHSTPLPAVVRVERIFDARFVMSGHLAKNMAIDMGRSAILRIGNVHIVVTSRSGPHFAPQLFECAGLDPFAAQLLIAKSPCGFRQSYAPRAKQIFVVRAPGCAPSDFWRHPFHRITRPLWPWDEIEAWAPAPLIVGR